MVVGLLLQLVWAYTKVIHQGHKVVSTAGPNTGHYRHSSEQAISAIPH